MMLTQTILYYLSDHPVIVNFRWSHTQSWGSTWVFLVSSIAFHVALTLTLHVILSLLRPSNRPVPLGPIPALHSLAMALISATIFAGILLSAVTEIRDTRWFWRRTKTADPFQWLLCFPLGTRPSGRVFFWSYVFYLSRFLHALRTVFAVFARRRGTMYFRLFNHSILIVTSFLWLEYSQSFQVLAILLATSAYAVVYGYRFWTALGLRRACFDFVISCQMVLLGCNILCHIAVLLLHLIRGGCNGMGAWICNSVLNGATLFMVLNFYVKVHLKKGRVCEQQIDKVKEKDA